MKKSIVVDEHRPRVDLVLGVGELPPRDLLVDDRRLDEELSPGRERRAHGGDHREDPQAVPLDVRVGGAVERRTPVRLGEDPGDDVREQHEPEDKEHRSTLRYEPRVTSPDPHGDHGHGDVGRHVEEPIAVATPENSATVVPKLAITVARMARRDLEAEVLADETGEPAPSDHADAGVHLLHASRGRA